MSSRGVFKSAIALLIPILSFAQIERWVYVYDGTWHDQDVAYAVACGSDSNIYAAGMTVSVNTGVDFIVASLDDSGDTNWLYVYDGAGYDDIATSIVYGLDGNIYASGMSTDSAYWDLFVVSLTVAGDTNWTCRMDGPGGGLDIAHSLTYGLDGNIYLCGALSDTVTSSNFIVASFSSEGDTNWTYQYSGTSASGDAAYSVVYGDDGNVYAAGYCSDTLTSWDFLVVSLSAAGDTNWTYRHDGGNSYDAAYSIVYGQDGGIYAAGRTMGIDGASYLTVICLASTGDEKWVYTYRGDSSSVNMARDIVYGSDNNIYVAGRCTWMSTSDDFMVISLTTAGETNWTYRLSHTSNFCENAEAIVYGSDGRIYAAGTVNNMVSARDFAVVCLDASGVENWVYSYSAAPSYYWDEAYAIDYGSDGNVYAAGYSILSTGAGVWNFTVISLDPNTGIEEEQEYGTSSIAGILTVAPNPFTERTIIRYSIPDARYLIEDPTIKIYDATGRLVKSFDLESNIENQESVVSWDGTDARGNRLPGGIYFAGFGDGNCTTVEKLLLVR